MALAADIVINGLAILCRRRSGRPNAYDLEAAFAERISGGPTSFVIRADGGDRFAEGAIIRGSSWVPPTSLSPAPFRAKRCAGAPADALSRGR